MFYTNHTRIINYKYLIPTHLPKPFQLCNKTLPICINTLNYKTQAPICPKSLPVSAAVVAVGAAAVAPNQNPGGESKQLKMTKTATPQTMWMPPGPSGSGWAHHLHPHRIACKFTIFTPIYKEKNKIKTKNSKKKTHQKFPTKNPSKF